MKKKADPGMLGSPVHGIWPQRSDPPLYIPNKNRGNRGHTSMLGDFWNFPEDEIETPEDATYPEPNAWRRTRPPFAIGNVPSIEDIEYGDEDLTSPWSGSPRSPWYHGNDFLIDGPYGDSGDSLSDSYFYNNMVPVPKINGNYATEKMLRDLAKMDNISRIRYLTLLRRNPTLPTKKRKLTPSLWDFMGEGVGPNTGYYGFEPSTGGGGAGLMAHKEKDVLKYADSDSSHIEGLIEKIRDYRGSLDYSEVALLINPLMEASKSDRRIFSLTKRLKVLAKLLQNTTGKYTRRKIKNMIRKIIELY